MRHFRKIAIGEDVPNAVTVGIERNAEGEVFAAVWWSSQGDMDAEEIVYQSVPQALEAAAAAKELYGLSEIVVTLQSDDLWRAEWGELRSDAATLSEAEALELARATEASRDA